MNDLIAGPSIILARRTGFGYACAVCPAELTNLTIREALYHFMTEHGTEADASFARSDFPGMHVPDGIVGDDALRCNRPW